MAKITIPYKPRYPELHAALESRRFSVLVAHRRFGKTVFAVNHLLKQAAVCRRERGSFAYVAPFRNQAKAVAWDYLKHYSAPVPGRAVHEGELSVLLPNGAKLRIFGADNPDALRGLYFDGVVLDEVAQMKPEVWEEIVRPALSDRMGWALFIGPPKGVNLFSDLYYKAAELQAEGDPDWYAASFPVTATSALPPSDVENMRRELSDNAWRQEMLCDFTASSDDTLIGLDDVTEAMSRRASEVDIAGMPVILGVDVARFGSDSSVVFRRQGLQTFPPTVFRNIDNMALADRVAALIMEHRPHAVFVDAGQGQGVIDRLRQLGHRITEVPFGGSALRDKRFVNRRAEMWYGVREWLKSGGRLVDDECLKAELTAPTYSFDASGRIKLEPKDEIKARLNRSTDRADALALTFAAPVAPPESAASLWRESKPYDPLAW